MDKNGNKRKLTVKERIEIQLEDITNKERKIFKKRKKVENVYAIFKQKPHFTVRCDKHIVNMYNLILLYFCRQIKNIINKNDFIEIAEVMPKFQTIYIF